MLTAAVIVVACCVVYFFSSGVALVLMYRIGRRFPSRLAAAVYSALEVLAKRSAFFQGFYTGFQWWMYRRLVRNTPLRPLHAFRCLGSDGAFPITTFLRTLN
jgi:hypothetical protein